MGVITLNIKINGNDLHINDNMYETAKKIADFTLDSLKAKAKSNNQMLLFYAIIISLHLQTGELLHLINEEELDLMMKAWENPTKNDSL